MMMVLTIADGHRRLEGDRKTFSPRATCESCHGAEPHPADVNNKLNEHVDKIARQTCHVPSNARGGKPTKAWRDWSTAGKLKENGKPVVKSQRTTPPSGRASTRRKSVFGSSSFLGKRTGAPNLGCWGAIRISDNRSS
jgi:hypothetical protein